MKTKQDLSVIYHNWYAYGLGNPSKEQKEIFWEEVFKTEDEQFIKEKILNCDLDAILVQYIQHVSVQRDLSFPEVMEVFSLWWNDVLSEHKQKCAHVLHSLLSDKGLLTGTEEQNQERLKDMIQSEQWSNALIHHNPNEYPSHAQHSWGILKNIFKEQKYTDDSWHKTLGQLDVYMTNGGRWVDTDLQNRCMAHILLMPLLKTINKNGDTQKLHDLFQRGINTHAIPLETKLCQMYDQYFKQVLINEIQDENRIKIQRKI